MAVTDRPMFKRGFDQSQFAPKVIGDQLNLAPRVIGDQSNLAPRFIGDQSRMATKFRGDQSTVAQNAGSTPLSMVQTGVIRPPSPEDVKLPEPKGILNTGILSNSSIDIAEARKPPRKEIKESIKSKTEKLPPKERKVAYSVVDDLPSDMLLDFGTTMMQCDSPNFMDCLAEGINAARAGQAARAQSRAAKEKAAVEQELTKVKIDTEKVKQQKYLAEAIKDLNAGSDVPTEEMTAKMKDIRDIGKTRLGCDVDTDRSCAIEAASIWITDKRAGAAERSDNTYAEMQVKALMETQADIYSNARNAGDRISKINQSLSIVEDPNMYFGTGGELVGTFKTLLSTIGLEPPEGAANTEQFRVNAMDSVINWIGQTKGAISEMEMRAFIKASPGLSKSREGNRLILETAKKISEYQQAERDYHLEWLRDTKTPTINGWEEARAQWSKDNKVELPTISALKDTTTPAVSDEPPPVDTNKTIQEIIEERNKILGAQ